MTYTAHGCSPQWRKVCAIAWLASSASLPSTPGLGLV